MMSDLVGTWTLPLADGRHKVEFEHGTTSGKRVIRVDGVEIHREEWMFKLVGKEFFKVGEAKCVISIDACAGFAYEYTLEVNGKALGKFKENQDKIQKVWVFTIGSNTMFRIVLEKNNLNVWVNGKVVETTGEFTDDGTETHFMLGEGINHNAYIRAYSSGKRREGIVHKLYVDDQEIPDAKE